MELHLPDNPVPDRVSLAGGAGYLQAFEKRTFCELEGPGCIRHIWVTVTRTEPFSRKVLLRIYFDGEQVPHVEAPVGDFFGVMHGKNWYPIDSAYLSVKAESGYNCYFPMPFARSARIEFECGDTPRPVYLMVDWHRYPGREMTEPLRFCARWRREMPTQRYGEDFLMLDADGPGRLAGFVYGVRLIDNVDRWSHGGADNIYIDGQGEHPAYLRGIGGEDTFGTSYGGALHPPESHLYTGMPYYVHDDVSDARPAQRLVGYRFFEPDAIQFRRSIHVRFGTMQNDICATTYWYQEGPVRPFCRMPDWPQMMPGAELRLSECGLELPWSGAWWLCGPFGNKDDCALRAELPAEVAFDPAARHDAMHEQGSAWLEEASRQAGLQEARWVRRAAVHGFVDFNHVFRPRARGAGRTHPGVALARCTLTAQCDMTARLRVAWDDSLVLRVNGGAPQPLGRHAAFRVREVQAPLKAGPNTVVLKLSNELGINHGGWAFAFQAVAPDGTMLLPEAAPAVT